MGWFAVVPIHQEPLTGPIVGGGLLSAAKSDLRMIAPSLEKSLSLVGKRLSDYDTMPDRSEDPEATAYCPRCHSLFSSGSDSCTDCRGIHLIPFGR